MRQKPKRPPGRTQKKPSRFTPAQLTLIKQLLIGSVSIAGVVLLGVGIWYGTRIEVLTIADVHVVGGTTVSPAAVEEKVVSVLDDSYFRLVPHRFTPLYPASAIGQAVMTIPRVKNVAVDTQGRQTLVVIFDEYVPAALWCDTASSSRCLFLDHTGYAFTEAPELNGSALERYVVEGEVPTVGTTTLPAAAWQRTQDTIEQFRNELDLYVTRVTVHDEVDSTYHLARGGALKVSNRLSADETITNLDTIFQNESFDHLGDGDFHYIDLRFGDRIFVAEEEWQEAATTTDEVAATSTPLGETAELETD